MSTVNPYFPKGVTSEQSILQGLVTESIQIQGMEVLYLPRKLQKLDLVFGEDILSKFDTAIPIEMYMFDPGWQGQNDLITKFGLQVREQAEFILSKPRWETIVKPLSQFTFNKLRPQEGDLIYEPVTNNLFEIKYVSVEKPYFQLNKTYQWSLTCELFVYSNERLDTGIPDIDNIEEKHSQDMLNYQINIEDGFNLTQEDGKTLVQDSVESQLTYRENTQIESEKEINQFNVENPFGGL